MDRLLCEHEIIGYTVIEYEGAQRTDQYFVEDIQDDHRTTWTNELVAKALDEVHRFGDAFLYLDDKYWIRYVAHIRY